MREVSALAGCSDGVLRPAQENSGLGDVERSRAVLEHLWNTNVVHRWGPLVMPRRFCQGEGRRCWRRRSSGSTARRRKPSRSRRPTMPVSVLLARWRACASSPAVIPGVEPSKRRTNRCGPVTPMSRRIRRETARRPCWISQRRRRKLSVPIREASLLVRLGWLQPYFSFYGCEPRSLLVCTATIMVGVSTICLILPARPIDCAVVAGPLSLPRRRAKGPAATCVRGESFESRLYLSAWMR